MIIDSSAVITANGSPIMNRLKERKWNAFYSNRKIQNGKKIRLKNDWQSGDENQDEIKYFLLKMWWKDDGHLCAGM